MSKDEDAKLFSTEEWKAGEKKADDDLKHGRFVDFDSVDEVIKYLRSKISAEKKKE